MSKRDRSLELGEGVTVEYERKLHCPLRPPTHTPPFHAYIAQGPRETPPSQRTMMDTTMLRAPSPTYVPILARAK